MGDTGLWGVVIAGGSFLLVILAAAVIVMYIRIRRMRKQFSRRLLIEEHKKGIWLDYSFKDLIMELSGAVDTLAGNLPSIMRGEEVFEIYDLVHEEDISIRSGISNFLDTMERHFTAEIRVKTSDGSYGWYSLCATALKDKIDLNERLVVYLENIDRERLQERKLLQKAENDLLTSVYNKKTMEERIGNMLEERRDNQHFIFFMIDLDNFKKVNDTLGHIYGDKVLTDTAAKLREIFKANAVIGRLGGDEFAVCACFEAFDRHNLDDYINQKAQAICDALRETYVSDDVQVVVSSSVGIAVAPESGVEFETIYQKADKALYLSKRSGKDQYSIYKNSGAEE